MKDKMNGETTTIVVSQCKTQENKIQWKACNKDKHTIGWIAEE